jgi:hypothetical protein
LAEEVVGNGFGSGIVTIGDQLLAQPNDLGLDLGRRSGESTSAAGANAALGLRTRYKDA